MKNLENYGVLEMDAGEGNDVDGGSWLDDIGEIWDKVIKPMVEPSFMKGWNSVDCKN